MNKENRKRLKAARKQIKLIFDDIEPESGNDWQIIQNISCANEFLEAAEEKIDDIIECAACGTPISKEEVCKWKGENLCPDCCAKKKLAWEEYNAAK